MYDPGAPSGESNLTGGESLAIVRRWRASVRSSICAPLRLIEPWREGVSMRTRGVDASTWARFWSALGPNAVGCACGCGRACVLPFSTLVLGGLAVGKYLFAAQPQPRSTRALRIT